MLNSTALSAQAPRVLSVLRIVSGLLLLFHGAQKHFNFPLREGPAPELMSQFGIGGVIELVGGLLLLLGLFTRPVAFILSGMLAVAYWQFHAPAGPFPTVNGGEAAVLFCFVFFYILFAGPGPWSLDTVMREKA